MEGAESSDKASWTKEMLHIFCDICIVVIDRRMRPNTHFDKARWKFVMVSSKRKLVMLLVRLNLKTNGMVQKRTGGFEKKLIYET